MHGGRDDTDWECGQPGVMEWAVMQGFKGGDSREACRGLHDREG